MILDQKRHDILASRGHLLIEGGPGCGKTSIALLLAHEKLAELKPEQSVLFLSFSRAAVRQITDRMRGIFGLSSRKQLEVRTFHAFFMDLVRSHSPALTGKAATFVTPEDEARRQFDYDGPWDPHTKQLAADGIFVFDSLADTASTLLESSHNLRKLYSDAYPIIIVDEFQDTNVDQWRAVKALAGASRVVCLADPDQRIYEEFVKGVDEHRLEHLRQELSPTEFDLSDDNYRSPASGILSYANAVLRADGSAIAPASIINQTYTFNNQLALATHALTARLAVELEAKLGHPASIAVLAADNYTLAQLSEEFTKISAPLASGEVVGPIDHEFNFEADRAAAVGYVVATILEWPTLDRPQAITRTIETMVDFYRTVGGSGARVKANVLLRGLAAFRDGTTVRSKDINTMIAAYDGGIQYSGDPVSDWQIARSVLRGSGELNEMHQRVRHLRLLKATDDLAWGLLIVWDGTHGYLNATAEIRRILAERILDDTRAIPAAVSLMNMHRSKGKEFDGVIIAEGLYQGKLFSRPEHFPARSARRRLIRVAFTRARHRLVLIRPRGAPPLMQTTAPVDE